MVEDKEHANRTSGEFIEAMVQQLAHSMHSQGQQMNQMMESQGQLLMQMREERSLGGGG